MERKTILIADDEYGFRFPITVFLRNLNYDIIEASNIAGVMEKISKADIMIIDVLFPCHREGILVVKEIRNNPDERIRNIPVIFYSVLSENTCKKELKDIDIRSYCWFQKPFEFTSLRKVISELIKRNNK